MHAIVLFSHGSVLCGAARNLHVLAAAMERDGAAPIVEVGFLNYTEPPFAEAVAASIARGATEIDVVPYFLVAGKFVVDDLPRTIAAVKAAHPAVVFRTRDVIGFDELLADAVLDAAEHGQTPGSWRESLTDNTADCRENPKCPLYGGPACRVRVEVTA